LIAPAANGSVTNEQQMKVYGAAGEFINVGSSHVNIQGGFISVFRPDGTLHSTFDGNDGSAIINNDVEELAGPTGGGTTNGTGYNPGAIQVQAGEEGVWTVVFDYPPENYTSANFQNLMNGESWTRAANQPVTGRVALAWDITISQGAAGNMGGTFVEGRVYSNEYISIVSQNGNATSPTFFVLTRSGFLYQIDFMDADPWGFPLFSNSRGIVRGDLTATNQSFDRADYERSADISTWEEGLNYLYHPQAEDFGLLSNNKIFFNPPDSNMPNTATVTDIVNGNNTHTTWLFTEVASQNIGENPFGFTGDVPEDGTCDPDLTMQEGEGGSFVYTSQVGGVGQLRLDLDNNGSFDDPIDRVIESEAVLGEGNTIFWDGRDGLGNVIPANPNFEFNFDLRVRGGEIHILMDDVENNLGGVEFTRLNGVNSPSNIYFYDHSQIPLGDISGGGTVGNALPTTELYTYGNGLGNDQLLDFYTFVDANNFGSGAIAIAVETDCSAPIMDNDGDGIADEDDLDDDNDGISDAVEIATASNNGDTDNDGVPDFLDLDSDNDGIFDVIEAGHGQVDANGDGVIDGNNFGANGLHNPLASSADDLNAVINYTPADTDGDGVADWHDLDSDNDGIFDVRENQNLDQDNDGIIGSGSPVVNANGIATASANGAGITINPNVVNTDGTGGPDYRDLDSDGDGRLDAAEAGIADGDGDGILGTGTPTVNINGVPSATDSNGNIITAVSNVPDSNNDGVADFQEVFVAPPPPPVFTCDATTTPTLSSTTGGAGAYCAGGTASLSVSGTTGFTGPVNFVWTGPNGFSESGRLLNANTVYAITVSNLSPNSAGTYSLVVTTDEGCVSAPANITISVDQGPSASIQNNTSGTICSGGAASLSASPTGAGITYEWFRDGISQGTTNDPNFSASTSGSYTVIASQGGCAGPSSSAVAVAIAGAGPNASIQASGSGVACAGETVQLSASPTGAGITYEWFRDGISQGTTTDPTFNTTSSGSYTVIASEGGCPGASSQAVAVTVNAAGPNAAISSNASGDLCSGEVVTFSVSPTGPGITYEWFKDGVSQGTTGEPSFSIGSVSSASSGVYSVVASQNGCPGASSALITINVSTSNQIQSTVIIDNPVLCEGMDFEINASPVIDGAFYTWFLDGASFASGFEPFIIVRDVTIANTGSYSVQVSQEGCTSVESSSVAVNVFPSVTASLSANGSSICEGESLTLTAAASVAGVTYDWFRDGVLFTSTTNPSLQVNTSGTYTVVPRQDICEGPASNPVVIEVTDTPAGGTISAGNTSLCPGESVDLNASDLGPGVTYNWFINGNLVSTSLDPSYAASGGPTSAGTYTMIPSIGICEGPTSNAVVISIGEDVSIPTIAADRSSLCPGENLTLTVSGVGGSPNYEWFRDGVSIGTTSDPFFPTSGPGSYTVAVTNAQCGGGTSSAIVVTETMLPNTGAIVADNNSLCPDETVNITTTDLGEGITYSWFRDGQLVTTTTIPALSTAAVAGSYTMVPSAGGCIGLSSNAVAITVGDNVETPTLSADRTNLCPGEGLTLSVSGVGGSPNYEWFRDGVSIGATSDAFFPVPDATAGTYTVAVTDAQCGGGTSNMVVVTESAAPEAGVIMTEDADLCEGDNLNLTATDLGAGVSYNWFRDGALVSTTDVPSFSIAGAAGSYTMIPSINTCDGPESSAIAVTVSAAAATPTITANNTDLCPGEGVVLTANGVGGPATYEWFLEGASIEITDEPILTLENASAGNYTVTASGGDCGGGTSEPFLINVAPIPDESAIIMEIPAVGCGVTSTTLEANTPAFGTGTWSSSNPNVIFSDPNSATTSVSGITSSSTITWSLSNECGEYASDALMIDVEDGMATAVDDNFIVEFNRTLDNGNIMMNDVADADSDITIISQPMNGTATVVGGMLQYVPNQNFFGTDVIEYQICSNICPVQVCDQAFANINVEDNPECFIPDVITPNNDGFNDSFRVPCAASNDIGLKIFNRWGDEVFETDRYANDWAGTHDGEPLPPGPYYYILTEPNTNGEKRTGCISISR